MSDIYTPDEEQVREQYTQEQPPQIGTVAEKHAEFDRFIARVKAEAWDEGCEALDEAHRWDNAEPWQHLAPNPYRKATHE